VRPHRDPAGPVLRAPKTAELIASYIRGQVVRERHWRTHMEVVGRKLLPGATGAKTAVDLFG
jgi:hypothetical protein